MTEFTIGSQWKTRGGSSAIVVAMDGCVGYALNVYHSKDGYVRSHCEESGRVHNGAVTDFDLIEPWKDPVVHEGWVNVYKFPDNKEIETGQGIYKERAIADRVTPISDNKPYRIACIPIKFTEGEGL